MKHLLEFSSYFGKRNDHLSDDEIKDIENFADNLFKQYNIDVVFKKHFIDQISNERNNNKPITFEELENLFVRMATKAGNRIYNFNDEQTGVVRDFITKLNTPLSISRNVKNNKMKNLNMITIMRKNKFIPNNSNDVVIDI